MTISLWPPGSCCVVFVFHSWLSKFYLHLCVPAVVFRVSGELQTQDIQLDLDKLFVVFVSGLTNSICVGTPVLCWFLKWTGLKMGPTEKSRSETHELYKLMSTWSGIWRHWTFATAISSTALEIVNLPSHCLVSKQVSLVVPWSSCKDHLADCGGLKEVDKSLHWPCG